MMMIMTNDTTEFAVRPWRHLCHLMFTSKMQL